MWSGEEGEGGERAEGQAAVSPGGGGGEKEGGEWEGRGGAL